MRNLEADIYSPLLDIYNSYKIHDKINLPRNILFLTDGKIENEEDTLAIIEKNSNKYSVYSIGIGKYFDKYFIEKSAILGKPVRQQTGKNIFKIFKIDN